MKAATGQSPVLSAADYLATSPAPPLAGAPATAEQLVLLVHRGVDWDVWGGARRVRYWEALTDRVRAGTYAGPTLAHWWQKVSAEISSTPRSGEDRAALALLLATADQRDVLTCLRTTADVLVLRVRVAVESRRAQQQDTTGHSSEPGPGTDGLAPLDHRPAHARPAGDDR